MDGGNRDEHNEGNEYNQYFWGSHLHTIQFLTHLTYIVIFYLAYQFAVMYYIYI